MKQYNPSDIINVALVGHGSCGKTSVAEAMLYLCKETERLGKVNDSTAFTDYDAEERKRKISLSTAIVSTEFGGKKLNIIDSPGLFDFAAGMHEAVRAADSSFYRVNRDST